MQEPTDLPPLSPIVDYLVAIVVKDDVLVSGTIPISDDDIRCRNPDLRSQYSFISFWVVLGRPRLPRAMLSP